MIILLTFLAAAFAFVFGFIIGQESGLNLAFRDYREARERVRQEFK